MGLRVRWAPCYAPWLGAPRVATDHCIQSNMIPISKLGR